MDSPWGVKTAATAAPGAAPAGGGGGAAAAAAGGVGRAQLRHFSDLLLSAPSESADASASLEATQRELLLGGPPIRETGGERALRLATAALRSQRVRQHRQQQLLQQLLVILHAAAPGIKAELRESRPLLMRNPACRT
ncbi:hypothetical protein ACSSS7_006802 [Eimeria intestinalis]